VILVVAYVQVFAVFCQHGVSPKLYLQRSTRRWVDEMN
jgi:hypothetical protein